MAKNGQAPSMTVLIDADNTSARYGQAIFEEIVKLGEANPKAASKKAAPARLE